jgi:hypothetical protein
MLVEDFTGSRVSALSPTDGKERCLGGGGGSWSGSCISFGQQQQQLLRGLLNICLAM